MSVVSSFDSPVRWRLASSGGIKSDLSLLTRGQPHADHLEMSGRCVNAIIQWKIQDNVMSLKRWVRWPMVREVHDTTRADFNYTFDSITDSLPLVDGVPYRPTTTEHIAINGCLSWQEIVGDLKITRTIFPSTSLPCLLERWEIRNTGSQTHHVRIPSEISDVPQPRELFKFAAHTLRAEWIGPGLRILAPGESMTTGLVFSCREENAPPLYPDIDAEWAARSTYRDSLFAKLHLATPDPVINQLFAFSKLRAAENVLATRGGLMHAPGGFFRYLAALWCNDQNEYVSPFFPFLGDAAGNESAINAYRWFATYQNDEYQAIPSSIVAEGRDVWKGAKDRGDAAMTAYGLGRWALATGDEKQARSLWPFLRWCLEYCERQKDARGLIQSDSDELENRFSAGRTNLATSCLTYDALLSAAHLATALGEPPALAQAYTANAQALGLAIETHFGATIHGFETYRYHEGLERLRAWICFPLVVGLTARAKGTVTALFSPELWTQDGLVTEAGATTRWDRSTLYALRGAFAAGYPNEALEHLLKFATTRLLGDHVPYCLEAFPEANQSQLSAESGLFCRIVTEGICGIRPTGFDQFECTPYLPDAWPGLSLKNIQAFARSWNLQITRQSAGLEILITLADGHEVYRVTQPQGFTHIVKFSAA